MKKTKVGVLGNGFVGEAISFAFSSVADVYVYDTDLSRCLNDVESVHHCDFVFVCVPTPMYEDGSQDLSYVESVFEKASDAPIYILKSTVLPGTTEKLSKKYPNIYIFSDDIYEHLLYEKIEKFTTIGEIDDEINSRTITMNGVSKAYSMTGWRIGYCGGPKKIIDSMRKLQGQSTSNPSSISQWAAVEALNGDQSFLKDWLKSFEMRRNKVFEMINSAEGLSCLKPKGAFYIYPSCEGIIGKKLKSGKQIKNDEDFAMNLLKKILLNTKFMR